MVETEREIMDTVRSRQKEMATETEEGNLRRTKDARPGQIKMESMKM